MNTAANLVLARSLVSDPGAWTTGQLLTRDGQRCAVGALIAVLVGPTLKDIEEAWRQNARIERSPEMTLLADCAAAAGAARTGFISTATPNWCTVARHNNDENTGHAGVLAMFDCAIARAAADRLEAVA